MIFVCTFLYTGFPSSLKDLNSKMSRSTALDTHLPWQKNLKYKILAVFRHKFSTIMSSIQRKYLDSGWLVDCFDHTAPNVFLRLPLSVLKVVTSVFPSCGTEPSFPEDLRPHLFIKFYQFQALFALLVLSRLATLLYDTCHDQWTCRLVTSLK